MTGLAVPVDPGAAAAAASIGIDACLAAFDRLIAAARALGVATDRAEAVRADAAARLGFPSDAYVVALVGGTGVGKSSLLNALAGREVSSASVRRPTTDRPVALVPPEHRDELDGLLGWLGVAGDDVRVGAIGSVAELAILDLPDLDSTQAEHRRRVEAVLPRIDAVVWVTDPEKYADAVLHDDFLRRWVSRLDRQAVVVNKADRLSPRDAEDLRRDLARDLARLGDRSAGGRSFGEAVPVVMASTLDGRGSEGPGASGIADLIGWLAANAEAKTVVRSRLLAAVRDGTRALVEDAGLDPTTDHVPAPLVDPARRRSATDAATAELLRIVDLPEVARQAVAATRARARARGAGPLGGVTSRLYRLSGREARVADPAGFLSRWRDHGSLGTAVEPIRAAVAEPLRTAPPALRTRIADAGGHGAIERDLGRAVDRAIAVRRDGPPSSRIWPVLGLLQSVTTLLLVAVAIWVVLWILVRFPVDAVVLPVLGRVPVPLVALLGVLAVGYLLARLLGAHAGWLGRRWAGRLAADVRANVERDVAEAAFASIDAIDADRRALADAAGRVRRDCGRG